MNRTLRIIFVAQLAVLAVLVVLLGLRWMGRGTPVDSPVDFTPETVTLPSPEVPEAPLEAESGPELQEAEPLEDPQHPAEAEMPADAPEVLRASLSRAQPAEELAPVPPAPPPEPALLTTRPSGEPATPVPASPEPATLETPRPAVAVPAISPRPERRVPAFLGRGTPERPHRFVRGLEVRWVYGDDPDQAVVRWSGLKPRVPLTLQRVDYQDPLWFGGTTTASVKPFDDYEFEQSFAPAASRKGARLTIFLASGASEADAMTTRSASASEVHGTGAGPAPTDVQATPLPDLGNPDTGSPLPPTLYVDGACA